MSLFYFLYKNGKWLNISNADLYNFALDISKSKTPSREKITLHIQNLIKKHLININFPQV